MSQKEKGDMRDFIAAFIKIHPLQERKAGLLSYIIFPLGRPLPVLLALCLIIVSGAGVSLAAQGTLPGDALYPVKVKVNEEVQGWLARSDEAKMDWLVTVAERRIEETEHLASQGRLNEKARTAIEASFDEKTKEIQKRINALEGSNVNISADIASRLEASLETHEKILSRLSEEKSESKDNIASMLREVKSVGKSVREGRRNFEDDLNERKNGRFQKANEVRLKVSIEAISQARNILENSKNSTDAEVRAKAEALIAEAEKIVSAAQAQIGSAGATSTQTLQMLQRVLQLSNYAKATLEADRDLRIKVLDFEDERD